MSLTGRFYDWVEVDCSLYENRNNYSIDFLACETTKGWISSHVTLPAFLTLLTGDAWIGIVGAALFELFETTAVTIFDDFVVFETADSELETMAGALIGDVGNGILGSLLAYAILWASKERLPTGILAWRNRRRFGSDWWYALLLFFAATTANIMIQVVYPADCIDNHPLLYTCLNLGHLAAMFTKFAIYYVLFFVVKTPPAKDSELAPTEHFRRKRDWLIQLVLWVTTTTIIELMSLQSFVPAFTGTPFLQVYVATLISIAASIIVGVWNRWKYK